MAPTPLGDHNNRTQSKGKQAAHKPTQDDDDDRSDSEEPKPKPKAGGRSDANSTRKLREEFRRLVGDAEGQFTRCPLPHRALCSRCIYNFLSCCLVPPTLSGATV